MDKNYLSTNSNPHVLDEKKLFGLSSLNSKLSLTEPISFSNYYIDISELTNNISDTE